MIDPAGEQLGSAARSLLDAAREGLGPDAAAVSRVRAKVGASVGAGAATAIAVKLGIVGVVAALAIGAGLYSARDHAAETPAIELPSARSETSPPVVRPTVAVTEPAQIEMAPQSAQRARPAVQVEGIDLAREVALIDLAMAELKAGDAAGALAMVHTHARETRGAGQLAEDAAAIEIEALCRLHDPAVAEKLDGFDARFPRSAQRSRLTTVCP